MALFSAQGAVADVSRQRAEINNVPVLLMVAMVMWYQLGDT